jgi:hypothetical protein
MEAEQLQWAMLFVGSAIALIVIIATDALS